jgi:cytochrome c-type biogenesis protein CcmH/NrfG
MHAAAVFQTRRLPEAQSAMEALVRRAVALDSNDADARSWLGQTLFLSGDYDGALAESQRALAISQKLDRRTRNARHCVDLLGAAEGRTRSTAAVPQA